MIGICRFYGKYPFCKQCRFNNEICEYYNMSDKEKQKYDKKFEYRITEQTKELIED